MTNNKSELVELLINFKSNEKRAELAALRRGASDPYNNFEALKYIGFKIRDDSDTTFKNSMLLATLFAIHPNHEGINNNESQKKTTVGKAMRKVRNSLTVGQGSLDDRFTMLLNADYEDLPKIMIQVFRYLSNHNVAIDYYQLENDIYWWNHPDKFVQLNWAKDYWGFQKEDRDNNNNLEEEKLI